jgi:ankyrin repeat protein
MDAVAAGSGGMGPSAALSADTLTSFERASERSLVASASAVERAAREARFADPCGANAATGAHAPFRGPAADSALGEALLDVLPIVFRHGHALELHRMRGLCGLTLRERAAPGGAVATPYGVGELVERRAAPDGVRVVRLAWATLYTRERVDERGFRGGAADVMACALEAQAPAWLAEARRAPREDVQLHGELFARTTSLIRAAAAGDERRVRELLGAGAPLRCVDCRHSTALHHASRGGCARAVAALLEADAAGAMVDAQDRNLWTPLMLASMRGFEDIARLLLARGGARQELHDVHGRAALHWAAWKGHAGVVELLCEAPRAQVDARCTGRTPLIIACESGHEGAARALLARGARQELQDRHDETALHKAALHGHARIVELLCAAPGAPVDARDKLGCTPLMFASSGTSGSTSGHLGSARALLSHGALQELQCDHGTTALHRSASADVVELLCSAPGAAVALALRDKAGRTPLAAAVYFGRADCAAVLRAHGAS